MNYRIVTTLALSLLATSVLRAEEVIIKQTETTITSPSTIIKSTMPVIESEVIVKPLARPNFASRLNHMREQIELGLSRGWITQSEADYLLGKYSYLITQEANLFTPLYTIEKANELERELNLLNIAITDKMQHVQTAGTDTVH
jgi:hypothetical protein